MDFPSTDLKNIAVVTGNSDILLGVVNNINLKNIAVVTGNSDILRKTIAVKQTLQYPTGKQTKPYYMRAVLKSNKSYVYWFSSILDVTGIDSGYSQNQIEDICLIKKI